MVSFGTKQGPIVPPSTTASPPVARRIDYNVQPAPVYERVEDTPNPNIYRAPTPRQYRNKFFTYKPKPNLILGTPLDIKYTPGLGKYEQYKRKTAKAFGFDYKGPQYFEKQAYEYDLEKDKPSQPFSTQVPYYQPAEPRIDARNYQNQPHGNLVPSIGIVYSSGVRYYVPQLVYYNEDQQNSVYDHHDVKTYHNSV